MGKVIVKNRKARYNYHILETYEAGISLEGTEVKSLRENRVKLLEAYCNISSDFQMEIREMEISPYKFGNIHNHDSRRPRKLLMHKREIRRLRSKIKEKGLTLVPLSLYFKKGKVKVEVAVCKGKKLHDKRASLKEKEAGREIKDF